MEAANRTSNGKSSAAAMALFRVTEELAMLTVKNRIRLRQRNQAKRN